MARLLFAFPRNLEIAILCDFKPGLARVGSGWLGRAEGGLDAV